jgi:hypothetical protein
MRAMFSSTSSQPDRPVAYVPIEQTIQPVEPDSTS